MAENKCELGHMNSAIIFCSGSLWRPRGGVTPMPRAFCACEARRANALLMAGRREAIMRGWS